ncbi:velvet factor-domain-containing protein [Gongronella butleri]|nr:velvet factor-domain-containing protein [Gongronella butleri]
MTDPISYQFTAVKQRRENRGDIEFELALRQQPKQSRMCGIGEKADRRPIDPPPIVQLRVVDPSLSPSESKTYLQNPYYFMYASLMASDIDEEVHLLRDGKTRSTTGSVVSSLYHLKDTDNTDAGFFVFPDLSVRIEGRYRLKLSLFEIIGKEVYHCKSILSDQFVVYSAKKFPGMEESTLLSRAFADQGLKIRIRKELRQRRRASKRQDSQPESSDKRRKQDDSPGPGHCGIAHDCRVARRHSACHAPFIVHSIHHLLPRIHRFERQLAYRATTPRLDALRFTPRISLWHPSARQSTSL